MTLEPLDSTAEGGVDRLVMETFFAGQTRPGILVEVGAARPDYLSIGSYFRSRGWRVISVEPNPEFCELHRQEGHEILQFACSDENRDNVEFLVVDLHGAEYE